MAATRRDFLKISLGSAGTLLLPGADFLQASEPRDNDHFFLMIVLNGGADSSYMFDARPLSMTRSGKIQNYLGKEPTPWIGHNGGATLASPLTKPLAPFRNRLSVLNGVYMTPSFDGHLQNMNFLFTGNPFGGDSFIPHLNLPETGREPNSLDSIMSTDAMTVSVDNHSGVVPLRPGTVGGFAASLREVTPLLPGDELAGFMRQRMAANAIGPGRMAAGTRLMLSALDESPRVHRQLAQIKAPRHRARQPPEAETLALIAECFRLSISRSAIYVTAEQFDVHAPDQARGQPKLFTSAIDKIATLFKGLAETPFDAKRSMFDVTTVMVASEFSRTMRAEEEPVDNTGTHHNQFSNSILLGGKGIRSGLVVGASDLATDAATASPAHLAMDPHVLRVLGCPFDFATMKTRTDQPDAFEITDYLTIGSVVNTIYSLFGVAQERYRTPDRTHPASPVLNGLLT
jgi:hypothetical protein